MFLTNILNYKYIYIYTCNDKESILSVVLSIKYNKKVLLINNV